MFLVTYSEMHTRASRIDDRQAGIRCGSPEPFSSACVKLGNFLREAQSGVARDFAYFELATGAPVFALLTTANRVGQFGAEVS